MNFLKKFLGKEFQKSKAGQETSNPIQQQSPLEKRTTLHVTKNVPYVNLRGHTSCIRGVNEARDGTMVVTASEEGAVRFWELLAAEQIGLVIVGPNLRSLALSDNGKYFAVGYRSGVVELWDVDSQELRHRYEGHPSDACTNIAVSHDEKHMLSAGWKEKGALLWDVEKQVLDRKITPSIGWEWSASGVAFSPNSLLLAIGNTDYIMIYEVISGKEVALLKGTSGRCHTLQFLNDETVGSVGASGDVKIQSVPDHVLLHNFDIHGRRSTLTSAAFSSDKKRVLIGDAGGYVSEWNLESEKPIMDWTKVHKEQVMAMTYLSNSYKWVSGDATGEVKLWRSENKIQATKTKEKTNEPSPGEHQQTIIQDAKHDDNREIRKEIEQIKNDSLIGELARLEKNKNIRKEAISNIDDQNFLAYVVKNDPDDEIRKMALEKITDQEILNDIAKNTISEEIRKPALENIHEPQKQIKNEDDSQQSLAQQAISDGKLALRLAAIERITDQQVLAKVVQKVIIKYDDYMKNLDVDLAIDIGYDTSDEEVYKRALSKIKEPQILVDIIKSLKEEKQPRHSAAYVNSVEIIEHMIIEKTTDQKILTYIATDGYSATAREVAIRKITNQQVLANLAKKDGDSDIQRTAIQNLTDQKTLIDIAKNDTDPVTRIVAIQKVVDQEVLADVATHDSDYQVRKVSIQKVADQKTLADVVKNEHDVEVRKAAIIRLTDQNVLRDIVKNETDSFVRIAAIQNLSDIEALSDIAKNEIIDSVRNAAKAKLLDKK